MTLIDRLNTFITAVGADIKSINTTLAGPRKVVGNVSTTAGATLTMNADAYNGYAITAQDVALTVAAPTGTPTPLQPLLLRIKDNGTARTITWNAIFRVIGITLPTTTTAGKTMYVMFVYNPSVTKWDAIGLTQET